MSYVPELSISSKKTRKTFFGNSKFRCECDAGYGPSYIEDVTADQGSQYLCRDVIHQEDSGKCEPLQTLNSANEMMRVGPDMLNAGLGIHPEEWF